MPVETWKNSTFSVLVRALRISAIKIYCRDKMPKKVTKNVQTRKRHFFSLLLTFQATETLFQNPKPAQPNFSPNAIHTKLNGANFPTWSKCRCLSHWARLAAWVSLYSALSQLRTGLLPTSRARMTRNIPIGWSDRRSRSSPWGRDRCWGRRQNWEKKTSYMVICTMNIRPAAKVKAKSVHSGNGCKHALIVFHASVLFLTIRSATYTVFPQRTTRNVLVRRTAL